MAAAKAAGEWAAAAAPAGGDGAGPEQGAGRLCRPLPGPRAGNKDARAPVGRTPARRPPRLRPATPGQAPGRGAGRNGGGKTRACCGQAPFLHPAKLPHAAPDTGWWPRPISSRAEPRAGPAVSHRLTPSPLSRTGPAAAVSSPLLPQTPPAQQLEREVRELSAPGARRPNPVTWAGCPAEGARPGRLTPAAAAGPLRALSGEGRGRGCLRIGRWVLMDSRLVSPPLSGRAGLARRPQTHICPVLWPVFPLWVPSFGETPPGLSIPYRAFRPVVPSGLCPRHSHMPLLAPPDPPCPRDRTWR